MCIVGTVLAGSPVRQLINTKSRMTRHFFSPVLLSVYSKICESISDSFRVSFSS